MSSKDMEKITDRKAARAALQALNRWHARVHKWEVETGVFDQKMAKYDLMIAKRAAEAAKSRPVVKDVVPKKGSKEYLTRYNGDSPFLVRYNKTEFTVFEPDPDLKAAFYDDLEANRRSSDDFDKRQKAIFTVPVMTSKYKRVFVGASHTVEIEDGKTPGGNTMLFEVDGGRYVCVSQDVVSFKPPERIESYESPVHGSDVPYPYAVGAKASYLLGHDQVTVPHADLQSPDQDPHDVASSNKKMREYAKAHPLPGYKVVRERRYT
jgi:hypothetical protein